VLFAENTQLTDSSSSAAEAQVLPERADVFVRLAAVRRRAAAALSRRRRRHNLDARHLQRPPTERTVALHVEPTHTWNPASPSHSGALSDGSH